MTHPRASFTQAFFRSIAFFVALSAVGTARADQPKPNPYIAPDFTQQTKGITIEIPGDVHVPVDRPPLFATANGEGISAAVFNGGKNVTDLVIAWPEKPLPTTQSVSLDMTKLQNPPSYCIVYAPRDPDPSFAGVPMAWEKGSYQQVANGAHKVVSGSADAVPSPDGTITQSISLTFLVGFDPKNPSDTSQWTTANLSCKRWGKDLGVLDAKGLQNWVAGVFRDAFNFSSLVISYQKPQAPQPAPTSAAPTAPLPTSSAGAAH